jgi:hypothetical protein
MQTRQAFSKMIFLQKGICAFITAMRTVHRYKKITSNIKGHRTGNPQKVKISSGLNLLSKKAGSPGVISKYKDEKNYSCFKNQYFN